MLRNFGRHKIRQRGRWAAYLFIFIAALVAFLVGLIASVSEDGYFSHQLSRRFPKKVSHKTEKKKAEEKSQESKTESGDNRKEPSPSPQKSEDTEKESSPSPSPRKNQDPYGLDPDDVKGKIAIIIDDFGNSKANVDSFCTLEVPITLAILPQSPYSKKIAIQAGECGKQVIMHLPLENYAGKNPGPGVIKPSMSAKEIEKVFEEDLLTVPGAVGFNNHEGSKATENRTFMDRIMILAKSHNLFFVDSRTSPNSVGLSSAFAHGVASTKRQAFIDNDDDVKAIMEQLDKLSDEAVQNGSAVGIGHYRANTLYAIKNMIPVIRKKGVKFVFVSEMVE